MDSSRRRLLGGLLVLSALAVLVGIAVLVLRGTGDAFPSFTLPTVGGRPTAGSSTGSGASPTAIGPRRVWLILLEDHAYGQLVGDGAAPFINAPDARFGVATDYHAVAPPRQPH